MLGVWGLGLRRPRPPKTSKNGTPQYEPITALGKRGDYQGVAFFGSFRRPGPPCVMDKV